jgi:hypothetical protein
MSPQPEPAAPSFIDLYKKTLTDSPFKISANVRFRVDYKDWNGTLIAAAGTPGEVIFESPNVHGWYDVFVKSQQRPIQNVPAIALCHENDWQP